MSDTPVCDSDAEGATRRRVHYLGRASSFASTQLT